MILDLLKEIPATSVPAIQVLDIGAMLEGVARYEPLVRNACAAVIGFEPQQKELERLNAVSPGTHRYLPYFLGRGGPATFHRTRYPGCSSIYEPDPRYIDLFSTIGAGGPDGNFHVVETSEVLTHRLDDVRDFPYPDLVKIDVQGAELDVIEGGVETLSRSLVLEVEVEFVPLYGDQPLFGEISTFLRHQGFQFHKIIDVGGRSFAPMTLAHNPFLPISQLLWADAVFVRDFAYLPRFTDEELLKASIILDEIYRSYDLAAYFLRELDRRCGSRLGARYAEALGKSAIAPMLLNLRETP